MNAAKKQDLNLFERVMLGVAIICGLAAILFLVPGPGLKLLSENNFLVWELAFLSAGALALMLGFSSLIGRHEKLVFEATKLRRALKDERDERQRAAQETESLILRRHAQAKRMVGGLLDECGLLLHMASRVDSWRMPSFVTDYIKERTRSVLLVAIELMREYKLDVELIRSSGVDRQFVLETCRTQYRTASLDDLFDKDFADWVLDRASEVAPPEGGAA